MKTFLTSILLAVTLIFTGCGTISGTRGFPPTATILNFDNVDGHLTRGAQPNEFGLEFLAQVGIKTDINLRMANDSWSAEQSGCTNVGMTYLNFGLNGMSAPSIVEVNTILAAIDAAQGRVFVHCEHGCDRTGVIVACYRIRHGMSNKDALNDAELHGLSPLEFGMRSFIAHFK